MSRLDELPPDQRAALSLLLRQGKSYAEVAALLGIPERAVHDRAHAALAMLAPHRARGLTPERRLEVGDYMLGQQAGVGERLRTRTYLSTSEPARAWASDLAAQLAPLAGTALPDVAAGAATGATPQRLADLSGGSEAAGAGPGASSAERSLPSSRVGGALLLAVLLAAVIVAVVLVTGGGSQTKKPSATSAAKTAASKAKTGPKIDNEIKLTPADPRSKSVGLVYVLSEGATRAFFIDAQNIPRAKGFYYAVWLYNSPTSALPLSKTSAVGASHSLAGGSRLPDNAGEFREILLTQETNPRPTRPGHVVLHGPFSLG